MKALREHPRETLVETLPGLVNAFGDFEVVNRVDSWLIDITVAQNCVRNGVVLIGDAYQTSCPAAGTGVSRLLTDIERLCTRACAALDDFARDGGGKDRNVLR